MRQKHKQPNDYNKSSSLSTKINNAWNKLKPYLTWRMALSFGIAWVITNGWSYLAILFGWLFNIQWLLSIGIGYQAFLWLPFTIEKPITFAIGVWIHYKFFGVKPTINNK